MIVFRFQFFQKASGTFAHSLVCLMQSVGIKKRNYSIDNNQVF